MSSKETRILRKWMWIIGVIAVLFFLAWRLGNVFMLLLLSSLVAYIINPLVTRLASLKVLGRTSATVIALLGLSISFLTVMFFLIPNMVREFELFFKHLPGLVEKLYNMTAPYVAEHFNFQIPRTWNDMFDQIYGQLRIHGNSMFRPMAEVTRTIFGTTFRALFFLASIFMFPLFIFFLLKDFPKIITVIDELIPVHQRELARHIATDIDKSLSAFLHGQFTVMLVLGTLYSIGYVIVGIPMALVIGLITGVLCFIPYLGAATGFLLALIMAVFSFSGWQPIWGVLLVFTLVQALDAAIITPKILGGKLGLQPLWIIIALMTGGELFGFLGILLAVPSVAILKIVVKYSIDSYKQSEIYDTNIHDIVKQSTQSEKQQ